MLIVFDTSDIDFYRSKLPIEHFESDEEIDDNCFLFILGKIIEFVAKFDELDILANISLASVF